MLYYIMETAQEISDNTWLSDRESELYIKHFRGNMSRKEASEEMGIETGAVNTMRTRILDKIEKSKNTVELEESI